jgi:hypothetical protein
MYLYKFQIKWITKEFRPLQWWSQVEFLSGLVAPGLPPAVNKITLYDSATALFAAAYETTSGPFDGKYPRTLKLSSRLYHQLVAISLAAVFRRHCDYILCHLGDADAIY